MPHRMTVAAVVIAAALLAGTPPSSGPAACHYRPEADRNAGLVAGEPKAGMLYLATRGRFYDYRCADGTAGIAYVPNADAR